MFHQQSFRKVISLTLIFALYILMLPAVTSGPQVTAQSPDRVVVPDAVPVIAPGSAYKLKTLLSDVPGLAPILDPLLVNPWGISLTGIQPVLDRQQRNQYYAADPRRRGGQPCHAQRKSANNYNSGWVADRHRRERSRN